MVIKFFGVRGSITVCNPEFQDFSGNTTCVQLKIKETNNIAVFDAGTGIRNLGKEYITFIGITFKDFPSSITMMNSLPKWKSNASKELKIVFLPAKKWKLNYDFFL